MASKLGGQNIRNDNGCEKSPRSEVAERTILWLPTRSRFSGKADVCEGRNEQVHLTRPPRYRS